MNFILYNFPYLNIVACSIISIMTGLLVLTPRIKLNSIQILAMWIIYIGSLINIQRSLACSDCMDRYQIILNFGFALFSCVWFLKVEFNYHINKDKRRRRSDRLRDQEK